MPIKEHNGFDQALDRSIFHWLMPIMIFTIDSNAFPTTVGLITNAVLFLRVTCNRDLSQSGDRFWGRLVALFFAFVCPLDIL